MSSRLVQRAQGLPGASNRLRFEILRSFLPVKCLRIEALWPSEMYDLYGSGVVNQ